MASFLFGRKPAPATKKSDVSDLVDYKSLKEPEIGTYQPNNPFKDLLLLPLSDSVITYIHVCHDQQRLIVGDSNGTLVVWDGNFGSVLAKLKYHQKAVNSIIEYENLGLLIVSSLERKLSSWNSKTLELVNTAVFGANVNKIMLNLVGSNTESNHFLMCGQDIRLFDSSLVQIDEYSRQNKEESIKLACLIKKDRFVLATNSDLEVYALVIIFTEKANLKLKLLKKASNVHEIGSSILCLGCVNESLFASGSSDGQLILWNTETLNKSFELRPFDGLNKLKIDVKLGSMNTIVCFRLFNQRYILICGGFNIAVYDLVMNAYVCCIPQAHQSSKITDLLLLDGQLVATSAEDGSIRVWEFKEIEENKKIRASLNLIGECLGHSASITNIKTLTKHEILSTGFDNIIIIWRNPEITHRLRSDNLGNLLY